MATLWWDVQRLDARSAEQTMIGLSLCSMTVHAHDCRIAWFIT